MFATLAPLLFLATQAVATPCSDALQIRLSANDPIQGGVVLLELTPPAETKDVTATWAGHPLSFWPVGPNGRLRTLLGVDIAQSPGALPLVLRMGDGPPCAASLDVRPGQFVERRLKVPKRYVELKPADKARAEREAGRLKTIFSKESERLFADAFRLPVPDTEPSDNFGQRRILNGVPRSQHSGVDFGAPLGAPVRAMERGRVALAESLFFSGLTVVIDHGLGVFSFYGHLSAIDVPKGAIVEAGTLLGKVGATGRATGPHLHWAVRVSGARVNPLRLVSLFQDAVR